VADRHAARRAGEALPERGGVLYYALGGGLGHLTRALAVRRAWARTVGLPFVILTNCRAPLPEPAVVLDLSGDEPDPAGLARLVEALLAELAPQVLVVDAFPAGVLGELPAVLARAACARVALLRLLRPEWVERWRLPALLPRFDLRLALEAGAPDPAAERVAAPLIRDAADLLPPEAARAALGCVLGRPVVCAVAGGMSAGEVGLLRLTQRLGEELGAQVRLVSPAPRFDGSWVCHYPLLEWLAGVDLLVGGAGFNLVHEARATGTPAIWAPQRRLYDDQALRVTGERFARSPAEFDALLRQAVAEARGPVPPFTHGAVEIAQRLRALVD
jgi:hypothetical protein